MIIMIMLLLLIGSRVGNNSSALSGEIGAEWGSREMHIKFFLMHYQFWAKVSRFYFDIKTIWEYNWDCFEYLKYFLYSGLCESADLGNYKS